MKRFKDEFADSLILAMKVTEKQNCPSKLLYVSLEALEDVVRVVKKMDIIFEDLKRKKRCKATMQMETDCEFEQFKDDFENGLEHRTYLDEYFYSDDFSENEIMAAQEELATLIKEYLHNNAPGEYLLYIDWSVRVIDKNLKTIGTMLEDHIVY